MVAIWCHPPGALGAGQCGAGAARVMVVPSVHKLLRSNPNYTYAKLYGLLAAFHPDLVGVEIRQEDLVRPEQYLQSNYPREMVDLLHRYPDRVFGFDWLGDELAGVPVPADWWTKRSRIKQLERSWDAAPSLIGRQNEAAHASPPGALRPPRHAGKHRLTPKRWRTVPTMRSPPITTG